MRNRVLVMMAVVVMLGSPCLLAAKAAPEWTAKIRKDHPRLFFNAETWPAVKARALGKERAWYEQFKSRVVKLEAELAGSSVSRASRPRIEGGTPSTQAPARDLGPEAAWSAFVFLMTDEAKYRDLAKKCLETSLRYYEQCFAERKTVNWYSTSRVHATMAWDWLYNHLTESERSEYMSRLVRVIDNVIKAKPSIYRENMSGYNTGFYGVRNSLWFIGCTAYGTGIEPQLVNEWLVWGREENLKMLAHRKTACGDDGGGASATLGYIFGAYPWAEQNFFYTWLSSTGENIAGNWPHSAMLANYVLWNWIETGGQPLEFGYGDTPHTRNTLPISQLYTHMANVQHLFTEAAPKAAALARYLQLRLPSRSHASTWFIYPFLLSGTDHPPEPFEPRDLPHGRHFETMGQVFLRSGTGADDTYCLFSCGGILDQHRHYDALNFTIYHRGFL
ncbi:MAG: hypothetical protein FJ280_23025, partial [Planctomycetes bacterium]|nr:hypothetical protein [Planctomycetota bacterium]